MITYKKYSIILQKKKSISFLSIIRAIKGYGNQNNHRLIGLTKEHHCMVLLPQPF